MQSTEKEKYDLSGKWRGWKITDEQAELIKQKDVASMTKFYEDNLMRIQRMTRGFIVRQKNLKNNFKYEFDDCVQQVFVDLPHYRYADGLTLSYDIIGSFKGSLLGGFKTTRGLHFTQKNAINTENISTDEKINENSFGTTLDYMCKEYGKSAENVFFERLRNQECDIENVILEFFKDTFSREQSQKIMEYRFFSDLSYTQIAAEMGLKEIDTKYYLRKLVLNYKSLLWNLLTTGYEKALNYIDQLPDKYEHYQQHNTLLSEKKNKKQNAKVLTPEQRARRNFLRREARKQKQSA